MSRPKRGPELTPALEDEIVRRYRAGETVVDIARAIHRRRDVITKVLDSREMISRSRGGGGRRRYWPEQEAEIVRRYVDGESAGSLARAFGGARPTVSKVLDRHGVTERHRSGRQPWRIFAPAQTEEIVQLWNQGRLSRTEIARRFGTTHWSIDRVLVEHGIQPVARWSTKRREQSIAWKGGRIVNPNGYVSVRLPPDDPYAVMCRNDGYVLEHRLVMARALGRPLRRDESVHHKNGKTGDNRLGNLQVRNGQHGHGVVMVCGDCGSHNIVSAPLG